MIPARPSKKFRALQQALAQPLTEIVAEYSLKPLTYTEIAAEWTVRVQRVFPELDLLFSKDDVYRLFKQANEQEPERQPAVVAG